MHTLASIRSVENVDLRLIYASALLDHVLRKIESDYIRSQSRNVPLGELVQRRGEYLGIDDLRNVNLALRIRNQVTHEIRTSVAHKDRVRAARNMLEAVDRHLSLLPVETRQSLRGAGQNKRKKTGDRQDQLPSPDSSQREREKRPSPPRVPSAPRHRAFFFKLLLTLLLLACGITACTPLIRNLPISLDPNPIGPETINRESRKPVQESTELADDETQSESDSDEEIEELDLTKQLRLMVDCNQKYVDAIELFSDPRFNGEWGRLSRSFHEEFRRLVQEGTELVAAANALEPVSDADAESPQLMEQYNLMMESGNKYSAALLLFHDPRYKSQWGRLSRPFQQEFTRTVQEINAAHALARQECGLPVHYQQSVNGNRKETASSLRQ